MMFWCSECEEYYDIKNPDTAAGRDGHPFCSSGNEDCEEVDMYCSPRSLKDCVFVADAFDRFFICSERVFRERGGYIDDQHWMGQDDWLADMDFAQVAESYYRFRGTVGAGRQLLLDGGAKEVVIGQV